MQKILQNKKLRTSLIFSFIGLVASICAGVYQISMLNEDIKQQIISQLGSVEALLPIAAVQGILITFIATFVGMKLARKVNLKLNFKFDKKALLPAIIIGFVTALIITGSDRFIFAKYLPSEITTYVFSPIYLTGFI